jgi:hypothetical protein
MLWKSLDGKSYRGRVAAIARAVRDVGSGGAAAEGKFAQYFTWPVSIYFATRGMSPRAHPLSACAKMHPVMRMDSDIHHHSFLRVFL